MLQRQYLNERCILNDPGRTKDEREHPTVENDQLKPKIEPCGGVEVDCNQNSEKIAEGDNVCPTVNLLQQRMADDGKPPPYLPQPRDDNPVNVEQSMMGPIGPWATGRPVVSPTDGMTGVRPVVDRYSFTRYSPAQWRSHNQTFFQQSNKVIVEAECLTKNIKINNGLFYKETDKNQLENRDKLSKRAGEIYKWKIELEKILSEITDEIQLLQAELSRVKQSLCVLMLPESISGEFLHIRSTRMGPDLVRDPVEEELVKEVALCSEVRNSLNEIKKTIEMQLTEMKTIKNRLEFDLSDKIDAYQIESDCIGLTSDSPLILMNPGATRVPPEQSSPESCENFTKSNLQAAESTRQKSVDLRVTLNNFFLESVKDLKNQAFKVNSELEEKINVTVQVCQSLEKELTKCLQELSDTEQLIEQLRGASKGLNHAMKVAQTRLSNRLQRPNVESCRDESQSGLIQEVKTLNENISKMNIQLKMAETAQSNIVKCRDDLEHEIMVKKKSLYVDRRRGQLLRSFYPSAEALSGRL